MASFLILWLQLQTLYRTYRVRGRSRRHWEETESGEAEALNLRGSYLSFCVLKQTPLLMSLWILYTFHIHKIHYSHTDFWFFTFWISCGVSNKPIHKKRHFSSQLPELPDLTGNWHRRSRAFVAKSRCFLVLQFAFNIAKLLIFIFNQFSFTF